MDGGRRYTAIVEAASLFDAALRFQKHCNDGPPEFNRPHVPTDAIVEVRPIFRVSLRKAMLKAIENETRKRTGKPRDPR